MYTIGLCGGSGCGKGYISKKFEEYGIPSIDTDEVYRELTTPGGACMPALQEAFGDNIVANDGSLNRHLLAEIVFNPNDGYSKKAMLEKITHKFVLEKVREMLCNFAKDMHPPAVLVDAPMLYESGFDKECNLVIAVLCNKNTRIERIIQRDNISKEKAEARVAAQMSDEELRKRADFIIINDGVEDTDKQVAEIAQNILRRR